MLMPYRTLTHWYIFFIYLSCADCIPGLPLCIFMIPIKELAPNVPIFCLAHQSTKTCSAQYLLPRIDRVDLGNSRSWN